MNQRKNYNRSDDSRCVAQQVIELDRMLRSLPMTGNAEFDRFKAKFADFKQEVKAANGAFLELEEALAAATPFVGSEPRDPTTDPIPPAVAKLELALTAATPYFCSEPRDPSQGSIPP